MAAKKISALTAKSPVVDADELPVYDPAGASAALKNRRATLATLATYLASKYPVPSQGDVEAGTSTTAGMITPQRLAQAIAALAETVQHNWAGSAGPAETDDDSEGYAAGSFWAWGERVWVCVDPTTNNAVWVEITVAPSLENPMTTAGDLIKGGASGAPARVAIGTEGQVLKVVSGTPAWAAESGGDGIENIVEDTTPQLGGPLDANGQQIREAKGADVASAGALTLGNDGNYFVVTGTTTITSIATKGVGTRVTLRFSGVLTLTHHATDLILPSGANITTAAGDVAVFREYASGDWVCESYQRASGAALVASGGMSNPMSASGDLIRGGASGTPTRVPVGSNGTHLTMVSGVPQWEWGCMTIEREIQVPEMSVATGTYHLFVAPTDGVIELVHGEVRTAGTYSVEGEIKLSMSSSGANLTISDISGSFRTDSIGPLTSVSRGDIVEFEVTYDGSIDPGSGAPGTAAEGLIIRVLFRPSTNA